MQLMIIFLTLTLVISTFSAFALAPALKEKYSCLILTNDYGILEKKDLADYVKEMKYEKFTGKHNGLVYWQCFPRENMTIILKDKGYSTEDVGWKDTMADLEIIVSLGKGIHHKYEMARSMTVAEYQQDFNAWRKLMKNEQHVCISGNFVSREVALIDRKKQETYSWIFDKIKTKKGGLPQF